MNTTPDTTDDWRALHHPDDPPRLEDTVDAVLSLITSAQMLHADWTPSATETTYLKAWNVWFHDIPRVTDVLLRGGIPLPCYPLEIFYRAALHSFLDRRSRDVWERNTDWLRDEVRHALRWTKTLVRDDPDSYLTKEH